MSIELKNINYSYSIGTPFEKKALNNINLKIHTGEFVGLIGHTGSGKSTLIQHFNGLIKPSSGQVFLNKKDIYLDKKKLKEVRQKVGLVFQYPEHQLFEMSVYKDIAFGPHNLGLAEDEIKQRVKEALDIVGLDQALTEQSPFELSGGQKRRVAIAGVLAMQPEILILDEPTAGLDPRGRDEILTRIAHLHKQLGITVILVSHSMEDIAKYVHRLLVMDKGEIKLDGTPKEVFSKVEELEAMGLAVPQITYLMKALKEVGLDIDENIIDLKQAYHEISKVLSE